MISNWPIDPSPIHMYILVFEWLCHQIWHFYIGIPYCSCIQKIWNLRQLILFLFSYGELSPSTFPGKLIGTCFPSDAKSWIKICCRWLVRPLRHLHTDSSHSNCCQQFCKLLQKQAVEKWGKLWEHLSNLFCWYLYTW